MTPFEPQTPPTLSALATSTDTDGGFLGVLGDQRVLSLLVLVVALALYATTLGHEFTYDDKYAIARNPAINGSVSLDLDSLADSVRPARRAGLGRDTSEVEGGLTLFKHASALALPGTFGERASLTRVRTRATGPSRPLLIASFGQWVVTRQSCFMAPSF
jgi:hypothetical protein